MTTERKRGDIFGNGGPGIDGIPGVGPDSWFNPDSQQYEPKPAKPIQANGVANRQPVPQRRRVPC